MINRGGFSFVAMLVINPIVILFYQNCSMAPISDAKFVPQPPAIDRHIASIKSKKHEAPKVSYAKPNCVEGKQDCIQEE